MANYTVTNFITTAILKMMYHMGKVLWSIINNAILDNFKMVSSMAKANNGTAIRIILSIKVCINMARE